MNVLAFDNSYARELPGAFAEVRPAPPPAPALVFLNRALADELGLGEQARQGPRAAALWAGALLPDGAQPIAQAYAGHQFGGFSPQLGDGRALLLGEVVDRLGRRRDIAFKGSGTTPFSRNGDGKAALGPMLREVLVSESLFALGVPTTRALAVAATGEPVVRERALPGAVLTRVASSHLRVGTLQYFAARRDHSMLRRVADYAIARHDPDLAGREDRYAGLLGRVVARQAHLIAQWMNLGFIHGVMNTDNMTLSGETIDYGPCAFMDRFDPETVFSSIDRHGRYAWSNQPRIAQWNLARLAEALLPLMAQGTGDRELAQAAEQANAILRSYDEQYGAAWLTGQRAKLGLTTGAHGIDPAKDQVDAVLAADWLALLHRAGADYTRAWRPLADCMEGDVNPLRAELLSGNEGSGDTLAALDAWLARWRARLRETVSGAAPEPARRAAAMRQVNPWIIARNHRVEEALQAASDGGDLSLFERLLAAVRSPWDETPERAPFAEPAPPAFAAGYRTFCGT